MAEALLVVMLLVGVRMWTVVLVGVRGRLRLRLLEAFGGRERRGEEGEADADLVKVRG